MSAEISVPALYQEVLDVVTGRSQAYNRIHEAKVRGLLDLPDIRHVFIVTALLQERKAYQALMSLCNSGYAREVTFHSRMYGVQPALLASFEMLLSPEELAETIPNADTQVLYLRAYELIRNMYAANNGDRDAEYILVRVFRSLPPLTDDVYTLLCGMAVVLNSADILFKCWNYGAIEPGHDNLNLVALTTNRLRCFDVIWRLCDMGSQIMENIKLHDGFEDILPSALVYGSLEMVKWLEDNASYDAQRAGISLNLPQEKKAALYNMRIFAENMELHLLSDEAPEKEDIPDTDYVKRAWNIRDITVTLNDGRVIHL